MKIHLTQYLPQDTHQNMLIWNCVFNIQTYAECVNTQTSFFCNIRALRRIKAGKPTREDDSLTDTVTYPVPNAYKVSLLNVETLMVSQGLKFC